MAITGKQTSLYLSDDLAAAVESSGVPLAELVRRGLGAGSAAEPSCDERPPAEAVPHALAGPAQRRRCPHPGTRTVGGWCRQCGVVVEAGGHLPG